MKNVKFGLLALVSIVGIGGAFASKPHKFNGTTYYAVTNGTGGYSWGTTAPNPDVYACAASSIDPYCTIVTNATPNYVPPVGPLDPSKLSFHTSSHGKFIKI